MKLNLKPAGDKLILKPIAEEQYKGKIIIPDAVKEKPAQGIVLAVGPGRRREDGTRIPVEYKTGDKVPCETNSQS